MIIQFLKTMLQIETLKIYGANIFAFATAFTSLNDILKVVLMAASIVYTVVKTVEVLRKLKKDK